MRFVEELGQSSFPEFRSENDVTDSVPESSDDTTKECTALMKSESEKTGGWKAALEGTTRKAELADGENNPKDGDGVPMPNDGGDPVCSVNGP